MNTAVLFLCSLLAVVAVFDVCQADRLDEEKLRTPLGMSGAMIEEAHEMAKRATGEEKEHAQGLAIALEQAGQVVKLAKAIKERDVHTGIEIAKKAFADYLATRQQ